MESIVNIILIAFALSLVALFYMLFGLLSSTFKAKKAGQLLANEMGLRAVSMARDPALAWFEGEHRGYPFALRAMSKYVGRGIENRRSYRMFLQLAVGMRIDEPLGFKVKYDQKDKALSVYNVEEDKIGASAYMPAAVEQGLWDFVQKGYSRGYEDGDLRFSPGTREIDLGDRARFIGQYQLGETVLTSADILFIHDHARPNRSVEDVTKLLDEMLVVVQAFETANA